MRKTTYEPGAIVEWRIDADPTPRSAASHALDGGSWTFQRHTGQGFLRTLAALLTTLALLAAAATPALAGKGGNGGGGGGGGPQSCDAFTSNSTVTLPVARQAVGADVAASQHGLTGAAVGVAVIDTGINRVPGLSGNGKVVDGPDLSFDALNSNLRHRDLHGHGTNMAAIIAAQDSAAGSGIAPGAHLVNVKVGTGDGTVDVSQVIAAIDWVVQNRARHNIRVINLAYDTDATQSYVLDPLSHAVETAWKAGIVVVVAGGNDGRSIQRLGNPATNPFVIAAGAVEKKNSGWNVPTWSSTGDGVRNPDVVAPGGSVLSAAVPGSYLADTYPQATCVHSDGSLYLRGSGTSQAAAVVSGMAALLLEQRPNLTPDQVKHLLRTTTKSTQSNNSAQSGQGMAALVGPNNVQLGAVQAPSPGVVALQTHVPSTGLGSLDAARGSFYVGTSGDYLAGDLTAFGGTWTPTVWRTASDSQTAWTNQTWSGATWSGGTWMGATWSGATWSGATWSGATWSGATWSGATWSGATWSGATWSGATWSGATWSGATWSGATWS